MTACSLWEWERRAQESLVRSRERRAQAQHRPEYFLWRVFVPAFVAAAIAFVLLYVLRVI